MVIFLMMPHHVCRSRKRFYRIHPIERGCGFLSRSLIVSCHQRIVQNHRDPYCFDTRLVSRFGYGDDAPFAIPNVKLPAPQISYIFPRFSLRPGRQDTYHRCRPAGSMLRRRYQVSHNTRPAAVGEMRMQLNLIDRRYDFGTLQ